jgi:ActD protein
MSGEVQITGTFGSEEACAGGIEALLKAGLPRVDFFAPIPSERLLELVGLDRSPVRAWVLIGGITGALSGFALTIGTSLTWPHVVGGKPIVSIPPYIIIAFELMILLGGLSAVIGFLVNARVPSLRSKPGYSPRFSADQFGVTVRCEESEAARAERILKEAGAEEVARET